MQKKENTLSEKIIHDNMLTLISWLIKPKVMCCLRAPMNAHDL